MSFYINDPTPAEIDRTIRVTLAGLELRAMYCPQADGAALQAYTLHLLERMREAQRLSLVVAYQEANTYLFAGDQVIAGPPPMRLETMLHIYRVLHCFHSVHNALLESDLAPGTLDGETHWSTASGLDIGQEVSIFTAVHFSLDPVFAEMTYQTHCERLQRVLAKAPTARRGIAQRPYASSYRDNLTDAPSERVAAFRDQHFAWIKEEEDEAAAAAQGGV